ncbi:MAG: tetratricopeptide repeat protein, partial [Actinomycetota bacterium]
RSMRDLRFLKSGRERSVFAAFFAAGAAFLMHAMVDWDWEMPAVALPFFMFSGALLRYGAISRSRATGGGGEEGGGDAAAGGEAGEATGIQRWLSWRLPVAVACVLAMLAVTFPLLSQLKLQDASQLARKGDVAGQEREARKAHSLFPLDAAPLKLEAAANSSRGRIKTAEALLQKALELEPYNDSIYRELAQLYIREGNLEMAKEMVRQSLKLNPLESRHTQVLEGQIWERGGGTV